MTPHRARLLVLAAWLLPAAAAFGGCRSMSDVIRSKENGEGTTNLHDADCDTAYTLAMDVFRDEGADSIEEHRAERYVLASAGVNAVSYGTLMGAWFEPEKSGKCAVTVVTKRKMATGVFTNLTEGTFQKRLAEAVDRRNSTIQKPVVAAVPTPPPAPTPAAEPVKPAAPEPKSAASKKPSKKGKKAPAKKTKEDGAKKAKSGKAKETGASKGAAPSAAKETATPSK